MDVPKNKLGLAGSDVIDVVNLKCDPILIGSLRKEPGIFPAYHMNKMVDLGCLRRQCADELDQKCCWI